MLRVRGARRLFWRFTVWFKILQWVQMLLTIILENEMAFPPGAGEAKKENVMKAFIPILRKDPGLELVEDDRGRNIVEKVSDLVDGLVALLNLAGAFRNVTRPPAATSTPALEMESVAKLLEHDLITKEQAHEIYERLGVTETGAEGTAAVTEDDRS